MPENETSIRIGTGERGGTFYTQGLGLKAAMERIPRTPRIQAVESPAGFSIENAYRLDAGDIDFRFISAPWVAAAKQGPPACTHAGRRPIPRPGAHPRDEGTGGAHSGARPHLGPAAPRCGAESHPA